MPWIIHYLSSRPLSPTSFLCTLVPLQNFLAHGITLSILTGIVYVPSLGVVSRNIDPMSWALLDLDPPLAVLFIQSILSYGSIGFYENHRVL